MVTSNTATPEEAWHALHGHAPLHAWAPLPLQPQAGHPQGAPAGKQRRRRHPYTHRGRGTTQSAAGRQQTSAPQTPRTCEQQQHCNTMQRVRELGKCRHSRHAAAGRQARRNSSGCHPCCQSSSLCRQAAQGSPLAVRRVRNTKHHAARHRRLALCGGSGWEAAWHRQLRCTAGGWAVGPAAAAAAGAAAQVPSAGAVAAASPRGAARQPTRVGAAQVEARGPAVDGCLDVAAPAVLQQRAMAHGVGVRAGAVLAAAAGGAASE